MKNRRWIAVVLFVMSLSFVGCQKSGEGPAKDGAGQPQSGGPSAKPKPIAAQAKTPSAPSPQAAPDEVVAAFLQALRNGDEAMAAQLLTSKAREETAKRDLAVQPPGAPSAVYRVGKTEFATEGKDGAYVPSSWTEKDEEGVPHSYDITWVLRQQSDGWRVAGMATKLDESQPALFLNFEDPEDMMRKWQEADARMAKADEKTVPQAGKASEQRPATTAR